MPEPAFSQPESRSFVKPILLALVVAAVIFFVVQRLSPPSTIQVAHLHTSVLPTHTVYKAQTIVLGPDHAEDVLFIVPAIHVDNRMAAPVSLDEFTLTLTNPDGAELTEKAATKQDIPALETTFPALTPMIATPLLRDTVIAPGKSAEGSVLFSLQGIPQAMWDARKSAVLHVTVYHQDPIDITLPRP